MMAINHSLKCAVPFSFPVPLLSLAVTHCHSLSLFVTRCHSMYHSLSLAVIRCHSLSLVVIRCHSLSLDVPLVCLFINGHSYIHFLKHSINLLKNKREFNCFRRCPIIFFTCFFKYSFQPFILNICFQS